MNDKFDYFMERTKEDFEEVKILVREIKQDVDHIKAFKWQIVGGATAVGLFVSAMFQLLLFFLKP